MSIAKPSKHKPKHKQERSKQERSRRETSQRVTASATSTGKIASGRLPGVAAARSNSLRGENRVSNGRVSNGGAGRNKRLRPAIGALFEALVALQARLRAPGGCPWDRKQSHDSLRRYLLEETYEVLDALDSANPADLAGELGDLLLQVLFHADLAREAGLFDIGDVIEHIHAKMVRRHPHVFGSAKVSTAAEVLKNWEKIKAEERRLATLGSAYKATHEVSAVESALDGVSRTLPALLEAQKLSSKASKVGFDWKNTQDVLDKIAEETCELKAALESGERVHLQEELGDLLFVCVNLARSLDFDAELALKSANRKFAARFREMERVAADRGQALEDLASEELEALWQTAKEQIYKRQAIR